MKTFKIKTADLDGILPARKRDSNKTAGGKVLIIAGGKKLLGAGILAAEAASRSGAGYTYLMTETAKEYPWDKFPDFIIHPLGVRPIKLFFDHVVAFGPGLGVQKNKNRLLEFLIMKQFPSVLVDADGLTLLSKLKKSLMALPETWLLTPHQGELARLLGISVMEVSKNPKKALFDAYRKFGCHIYLKGHEGMLLVPQGSRNPVIYSFSFGTKSLAKAGTGDVLLGIIAALRAQGLSNRNAVLLGVYIHGLSAKKWEKLGNDHLGLRPTDLIDNIPKAMNDIRLKKRTQQFKV